MNSHQTLENGHVWSNCQEVGGAGWVASSVMHSVLSVYHGKGLWPHSLHSRNSECEAVATSLI